MSKTEYKVLRCRTIAELQDQIHYYQALGWVPTGYTDAFDGMHVHAICIVHEADITEEITRPLNGLP